MSAIRTLVNIPDLFTYFCTFLDARTYGLFLQTSKSIQKVKFHFRHVILPSF